MRGVEEGLAWLSREAKRVARSRLRRWREEEAYWRQRSAPLQKERETRDVLGAASFVSRSSASSSSWYDSSNRFVRFVGGPSPSDSCASPLIATTRSLLDELKSPVVSASANCEAAGGFPPSDALVLRLFRCIVVSAS